MKIYKDNIFNTIKKVNYIFTVEDLVKINHNLKSNGLGMMLCSMMGVRNRFRIRLSIIGKKKNIRGNKYINIYRWRLLNEKRTGSSGSP